MKTFFNILQTIINKKNKTYPDEPFSICEPYNETVYTESIHHISFLINKIYFEEKKSNSPDQYIRNSYSKFFALNSFLENPFYKKELKETIFDIFSKSQKHYFAFSRLVRIYKTKKYPIVVVNDLTMNPLDIKHRNTFLLIENKSLYLFSLNDLVSIIETAIGNSPNFFSEPLYPVNPYNKTKFTNATLYNIYFKHKESIRLLSVLFHSFFLTNFNKTTFSTQYEALIRENAINKFVFNSHYTTLHLAVLAMLKNNTFTKNLNIHKEFPKDKLVDIFRPFLFLYYIVNYDIKNTSKIYKCKNELFIKLKKFYEFNKSFGRKCVKITKWFHKIIKQEYQFNTEHLQFHKISIQSPLIQAPLIQAPLIQAPLVQIPITVINTVINIDNSYNRNDEDGEYEDVYDVYYDVDEDDDNDDNEDDDDDDNEDDDNEDDDDEDDASVS